MDKFIDIIANYFKNIVSFVLSALQSFWNLLLSLFDTVADFVMDSLNNILPETYNDFPTVLMDYMECLNYWFPVKEMFIIIGIYIQFRVALFLIRLTVKLMSGGQV